MTTDVMKWLSDVRGISSAVLSAAGVRQVDHADLGRAIAFPYTRKGQHYADKFRGAGKTFRSTHGVSRGLYGEDNLAAFPSLPVVITEGEIDCLSVVQAGFDRAVSVPDGWPAEANKTEALLAAEDALRKSPWVIVAGDSDEAGESLPRAVSQILKGHDVRAVRWPEGCKDANDVLVKFGEGALAQCLNEAKRIDPPGGVITGLSDLPPLSDRRVLRIGARPFDWAVAFELGAMSVWTGIPGSGKSTFLTWAAERVSVNEDIRVGIMAFETHAHDIRDQLSLMRSGVDFRGMSAENQRRFLSDMDQRFRLVHVTLDETTQHLAWLESMIHTLAVRDRCKLIIIDPWNELEHLPNPGESMTQYINFATKFIRQMAEKLDVHIALVAHPKKMNTEGRIKAPTGYDVADSAAFYNKPSLGVTVHQEQDDDGDEYVSLNVWKVRKVRLYGFQKGKVKVAFDKDRMTYARIPKDQPQPA